MSAISKVHLDRCIEVAGDARAGVLLYHIMRWMKSTKVFRNGKPWATSSREEWAQQTGTSLKKVKADLDKLSARGLIIREKHMFMNRSVLFVRPTEECLQALKAPASWIKKSAAKGSNGADQSYPDGTDQSGQNGTDLYKLNSGTHSGTQKIANGFAVATPEAEKFDKFPGEEDNACISAGSGYPEEADGKIIPFPVKAQGGADMPTAHEIAAGLVASAKKPIDTLKPDKAQALIYVWRQHCTTKGKIAPHFGGKERGQLNHLIKIWPAGEAPAILEYTMSNWGDFTSEARSAYSAWDLPEMPEIGFLVKYESVAVTLYLKSTAKAAKAAKAKDAAAKPEPVQSIAQPKHVKEKPATFEEILAIEAEFQKGAA
jgi:hypothetical protein